MNNLFKNEHYIRAIVGGLLIVIAMHYEYYYLILLAAWLLFTATKQSCPVYSLLGINTFQARERFYLSELPKYNPEPMFIYTFDKALQYKNKNCTPNFISKIDQIVKNLKDDSFDHRVEADGKTYFINFEFSKDLNVILGYAFDATELVNLQNEIISTQKEIVYKMGEIGETRSKETGNHVKRVAEYSYLLAKLSGLNEEDAEILKTASPMHDIGKVGIPDSVLKKPGKLDEAEWEIMKTHTQLGYDMLKNSQRPIIKAASIVAKEHHEKYDGNGYPDGLKGEDIHIFARITAIADVFDALGSKRVYKDAWELDKILELFRKESGKHFDPKLVQLFFDNLDSFLEIRDNYQDDIEHIY